MSESDDFVGPAESGIRDGSPRMLIEKRFEARILQRLEDKFAQEIIFCNVKEAFHKAFLGDSNNPELDTVFFVQIEPIYVKGGHRV
jgi:hypothetical protein